MRTIAPGLEGASCRWTFLRPRRPQPGTCGLSIVQPRPCGSQLFRTAGLLDPQLHHSRGALGEVAPPFRRSGIPEWKGEFIVPVCTKPLAVAAFWR